MYIKYLISTIKKNKGCWFQISVLTAFWFQLCFLQYLFECESLCLPIRLSSPQPHSNVLDDLRNGTKGPIFQNPAPGSLLAAFQGQLSHHTPLNLTSASLAFHSQSVLTFSCLPTRILSFGRMDISGLPLLISVFSDLMQSQDFLSMSFKFISQALNSTLFQRHKVW